MLYLLITTIITTAIFTLIINTPITIGINILIIALSTATLYATLISSWIAFLLFLIYIRGTLVIFAYFVAMSPNTQIYTTYQIIIILLTWPITLAIFIIISPNPEISNFSIQSNTFYTKFSIPTLIILALVLLFTILIVVKISSNTKGPLRPFLNK